MMLVNAVGSFGMLSLMEWLQLLYDNLMHCQLQSNNASKLYSFVEWTQVAWQAHYQSQEHSGLHRSVL